MIYLTDYLHGAMFSEEPHLSLSETLRQKLATVLAGQEVIQQRMRRAVAELNIGYRHSPIVAEHHSLLPGPRGAHTSVLGWHDFGAGPRAGDRAADSRLMLCPGRESVRFFQRLRGTTHHLVLSPRTWQAKAKYFWIRGASYIIAMELGVHVCMWSVPTATSASAVNLPISKRWSRTSPKYFSRGRGNRRLRAGQP